MIGNTNCQSMIDELRDLIDRWRNKPLDDRPCTAEVVGCLHAMAFELLRESEEGEDD